MSPRLPLVTASSLLLVAILAGCQPAAGGRTQAGRSSAATSANAVGAAGEHATAPAESLRLIPVDGRAALAAARAPGATVRLVNVWATWCVPCREEFPDLMKLERAYRDRGFRLVLVSADFDDQIPAVRTFLKNHGVTGETYLKTGDDMEFIDGLESRWSGALPATLVLDASGRVRSFWEGRADYAKLDAAVLAAFEEPTASR